MKLLLLLLFPCLLTAQNTEDIRRSYVGKFSVQATVNTNDQYNNALAISKTNLRYPEKLAIKSITTKQFEGAYLTMNSTESFNNAIYVSSIIGRFESITVDVVYSLDYQSYVIIKSYKTGIKTGTTVNLVFSAYGDLLRIEKSIFNKHKETKFIYNLN